jgi:hypothetical protein
MIHRIGLAAVGVAMLAGAAAAQTVKWKKHDINDQSPFEAAGAADFNGDGKIDIFCGDSWYEAPTWKRHKVREVGQKNRFYHEDFSDAPLDVNGDGRIDLVTCNYFSQYVGWVENPPDPTKPWIEHEIDKPGSSEVGNLIDVNGDGRLDFLPNTTNVIVWYELVQQKPEVKWKRHEIGKPAGFSHGVGTGDLNGDGRLDIISPRGWYEQPADKDSDAWEFHPEFDLGGAGIWIIGRDFDGDGLADIVWGMGHNYGLFWAKQKKGADGKREWARQEIDTKISELHTLLMADIDGDKKPELITGKRIYGHEVEPGATDASFIYSFTYDKAAGAWRKSVIYEGKPAKNAPPKAEDRWALKDFERGTAGTGLHVEAIDIDGDGDIDLVCPGKTGLYLFENLGR